MTTDQKNNMRLFDLLPRMLEKFPKEDALAAKENGKWRKYSSQEYFDTVNNLSYGLIKFGLNAGDKVGIIANNRPEWNFVDYASMQIGAVDVPLYPTISDHDLQYVLNEAEVKIIFVSNEEIYHKVTKAAANVPSIQKVYMFNEVAGLPNWKELVELGKQNKNEAEVNSRKEKIKDTDLATLIYTSGTTGNPKGVMLSHKNLVSNFMSTDVLCPFNETWTALSFLPLNHVYERMLCYLYAYFGMSVYYAESLETIGDNLKEIKPQIFVTVPRLLEKVYDKIVAKGSEQTGIKRKLFFWALDLGLKYELHGANGWWYEFKLKIANKIIFSKWREALGGNIVAVASGGAALQPRLARVFHAAKIPILEGYGLTETSPVIAVNNFQPNCIKFGTVGTVIKDVQVKIAEDGEILCKGPNVMLGYYKNEAATKEVLEPDGWFHTGDIGIFEDGKYLKITDRKKEIFKTSGGKYIAPQMIENKLKESRFIEQAMVIGENEKFPSAYIVPAFAFIEEYCKLKNIPFTDRASIIKNSEIIARINEEIEAVNANLAQYERIKCAQLLPQEWTVERGEMTPKLSLKRKIIMAANKDLYAKIYN